MNIEEDLFKRYKVDYSKLIPYGFKYIDNLYIYEKEINNNFKVIVEIKDNKVKGMIYDLNYNEEYTNYRIKNLNGEFVSNIREEFKNILTSIRDNCFLEEYFCFEQANNITKSIIDKYGDLPEFLWDDDLNGVFRNSINKKWYALIMHINMNKFTNEDRVVDVLNIKLDPEEIINLLNKKGFYKAYHMNKKYWISIVLDNTVSNSTIIELIDKSYQLSLKK